MGEGQSDKIRQNVEELCDIKSYGTVSYYVVGVNRKCTGSSLIVRLDRSVILGN